VVQQEKTLELMHIHMKIACAPRTRGAHAGAASRLQRRVTNAVVECHLAEQRRFLCDAMVPPRGASIGASAFDVLEQCIGIVVQWDEASQKLRPILKSLPSAVRQLRCQAGAQVMVVAGRFVTTAVIKTRDTGKVTTVCETTP